jgi:hypothetical protein
LLAWKCFCYIRKKIIQYFWNKNKNCVQYNGDQIKKEQINDSLHKIKTLNDDIIGNTGKTFPELRKL